MTNGWIEDAICAEAAAEGHWGRGPTGGSGFIVPMTMMPSSDDDVAIGGPPSVSNIGIDFLLPSAVNRRVKKTEEGWSARKVRPSAFFLSAEWAAQRSGCTVLLPLSSSSKKKWQNQLYKRRHRLPASGGARRGRSVE